MYWSSNMTKEVLFIVYCIIVLLYYYSVYYLMKI